VLRDSRLRDGAAGSEYTAKECEKYEAQVQSFFGKRLASTAAPGESAAKKLKKEDKTVRAASLDWLDCIGNLLRANYDLQLSFFKEDDTMLVLSLDQEGKQWCTLFFLRNKMGLHIEGIPDHFHRRSNDTDLAVDDAGYRVTKTKGHLCHNIRAGPWQNGSFGNDIRDMAHDLARNASPNDEVLLHFWDKICGDKDWHRSEQVDCSAREAYLKRLPLSMAVSGSSEKSVPGRFHSYNHVGNDLDSEHWSIVYLLTVIAIRKRYITCVDNILPRRNIVSSDLKGKPISEKKAVAAAALLGAASSSSGSAAPAAPGAVAGVPVKMSKGAAKALVLEDRMKAHNSMHCVLQYMYDTDFCDDSRIILLFSNPVGKEHGDVAKRFKISHDEVVQQFAEWASWSWVKPLAQIVHAANDLRALMRIGFIVEKSGLKKIKDTSHPVIQDQNAKAYRAWLLKIKLLKHRASSNLWHTMVYPGASARLLHKSPEERAKGLVVLQKHVAAWEYHRLGLPTSQRMSERSMFEGAALKELVSFAKASEFKEVNLHMARWLDGMWGGMNHTLWNERANQKIVAKQTKGLNKTIGRLTRWSAIADTGFLEDHGLEEIKPCTHLPVPAEIDWDECFKHGVIDHGMDCTRISGVQDWETFGPHSFKQLYAEAHVMSKTFDTKNNALVDDAWKSRFVPEGQTVVFHGDGMTVGRFAIANLGASALCWPMLFKDGLFHLEDDVDKIDELPWCSVSDFKKTYIVPCDVVSPAHILIEKPGVRPRIAARVAGKPELLLLWQARHGFGGVPEWAMKKLYAELDLDLPDVQATKEDLVEAELACGLMAHLVPALTDIDCTEILAGRLIHPEAKYVGEAITIDDTLLDDCMMQKDARDIKKTIKKCESLARKDARASDKAFEIVHRIAPGLKKGKHDKEKNVAKLVAARSKKDDRWWACIKGNIEEILALKPQDGNAVADDANGRFFVSHKKVKGSRKSVSWTKRGMDLAVQEALQLLWDWERDVCPLPCPLPLEYVNVDR
jgi:hypothetical protein